MPAADLDEGVPARIPNAEESGARRAHQFAKHRAAGGGGEKIRPTAKTDAHPVALVVPHDGMIKRELHEPGKGHDSAASGGGAEDREEFR